MVSKKYKTSPKFQCNVAATFKASIFSASCFLVNCAGAGVVTAGGVGGASTSTTLSLVGLELKFFVSTDTNSSINSHAEGSENMITVKLGYLIDGHVFLVEWILLVIKYN